MVALRLVMGIRLFVVIYLRTQRLAGRTSFQDRGVNSSLEPCGKNFLFFTLLKSLPPIKTLPIECDVL